MNDEKHHSDEDDFARAFDTAAARLRAVVAKACAAPAPWPARACAAIEAALDFFAANPAAARLLLLDPGPGREGAFALRDRQLSHFARLLSSGRAEIPGDAERPALAEELILATVASLTAERLREAGRGLRAPGASSFASELAEFVLLHYVEPDRARMWSSRLRLASESAEDLEPVEFTEILLRLQTMIDAEAQVLISLRRHFFDCVFCARLERVETLSPGEGAVLLLFEGAHALASTPPRRVASSATVAAPRPVGLSSRSPAAYACSWSASARRPDPPIRCPHFRAANVWLTDDKKRLRPPRCSPQPRSSHAVSVRSGPGGSAPGGATTRGTR